MSEDRYSQLWNLSKEAIKNFDSWVKVDYVKSSSNPLKWLEENDVRYITESAVKKANGYIRTLERFQKSILPEFLTENDYQEIYSRCFIIEILKEEIDNLVKEVENRTYKALHEHRKEIEDRCKQDILSIKEFKQKDIQLLNDELFKYKEKVKILEENSK